MVIHHGPRRCRSVYRAFALLLSTGGAVMAVTGYATKQATASLALAVVGFPVLASLLVGRAVGRTRETLDERWSYF